MTRSHRNCIVQGRSLKDGKFLIGKWLFEKFVDLPEAVFTNLRNR